MARFTVTGSSGFIGANMVARLKDQGHWVRAVDVKETPERANLYERADEVWVASDLRDWERAREATDGVDRVIHLAADHGGAGYFYSDADMKAAINNLRIDTNVLQTAMSQGVDRLFFASSACTYPVDIQGKGAAPLTEDLLGSGEGEQLYGFAKRMSTKLMEGAREHGFDARSGVFHTIYGPSQDEEEPRAKFPTAICRKILENPARVEVWGDGTQVRTFLFITDALDKIQTVIDADSYAGPVNIGSDEEVTVQECCEWAADALGASPEWVYTDGPVGVAHRASDNTEWVNRYGTTPRVTAKQGFQKLARFMRDNRS
jgi:nucleoside-diphosphate-sugar epimerase